MAGVAAFGSVALAFIQTNTHTPIPRVSRIPIRQVDRTDTVRARLAAGLFERCAEWNGYGRCA